MSNENKSKIIRTGSSSISDVWLRWLSINQSEKVVILEKIASTDEVDFGPINSSSSKKNKAIIFDSSEKGNQNQQTNI